MYPVKTIFFFPDFCRYSCRSVCANELGCCFSTTYTPPLPRKIISRVALSHRPVPSFSPSIYPLLSSPLLSTPLPPAPPTHTHARTQKPTDKKNSYTSD